MQLIGAWIAGILSGALLGTLPVALAQPTETAKASANVRRNSHDLDGQHDFDWESGRWTVHLKRLVHPLSGSQQWSEYNGTLDVSKIWDGRANIVQFEATNATDHIEGLSVRLFNPKTHQWSISWASAADGFLDSTPVVGGFENGRGEFFGFQQYSGRWVLVRFIFSGIQTTTVRGEQSYSVDGGKTWEANWVEDLTRE